tara:strand:- start:183 stop:626 length:444 start_codon:yes stop_codon:yes gene_type:complete
MTTSQKVLRHPIYFDPENYKNRDFSEDYVVVEEIAALIYGCIKSDSEESDDSSFDVDDFFYDIISKFDQFHDEESGWFIEEDTDEKDSLRDEVYFHIGLTTNRLTEEAIEYAQVNGEWDGDMDQYVTWDDLKNLKYWDAISFYLPLE